MPQVFYALQCFQCSTFQVVQKTQQEKFTCKLCSSKQSIVRVYGAGAAKDMRPIVQQLNMARAHDGQESTYGSVSHAPVPPQPNRWDQHLQHAHAPPQPHGQGRWEQYLAAPQPQYEDAEGGDDDPRFVTSVDGRQKGNRKRQGGAAEAATGAARQREHLQRENLGANAWRSYGNETEGCGVSAAACAGRPAIVPGRAAGGRGLLDGGGPGWRGGELQPADRGGDRGGDRGERHLAAASRSGGRARGAPVARDTSLDDDTGFVTSGFDEAVVEEVWD